MLNKSSLKSYVPTKLGRLYESYRAIQCCFTQSPPLNYISYKAFLIVSNQVFFGVPLVLYPSLCHTTIYSSLLYIWPNHLKRFFLIFLQFVLILGSLISSILIIYFFVLPFNHLSILIANTHPIDIFLLTNN